MIYNVLMKNKESLIVHIEFGDRLSLVALGKAIESIGKYYHQFTKKEANLSIETISNGSISFSLISAATPAILS